MSKAWVVNDELSKLIEPVLPPWPPKPPGPRPVPGRLCLQGVLFVLRAGIYWKDLPQELGLGSGMTCWCPLQRCAAAGVFYRVHQLLLVGLNAANPIDWPRAAMGGSHIDARKGVPGQARRPSMAASPARCIT